MEDVGGGAAGEEPARQTAGLVLAAGRSTRMGRPKALLDVEGRTFLRAAVEALRDGGCGPVVAVVPAGEGGAAVTAEARSAAAAPVPGHPEGEQVESLRAGLDALDRSVEAAVVLPVDHPLVRATTVRALIWAGRIDPDAIVRPVHDGRPGHPTLFPRSTWPALRDPGLAAGARSVVESGTVPVLDVTVEDAGAVTDIDTPAAYRRHVGDEPGARDPGARDGGEPGNGGSP